MLEVTPLTSLPQNKLAERSIDDDIDKAAERDARTRETVREEPNQDKVAPASSDAHAGHDGNKGSTLDVVG